MKRIFVIVIIALLAGVTLYFFTKSGEDKADFISQQDDESTEDEEVFQDIPPKRQSAIIEVSLTHSYGSKKSFDSSVPVVIWAGVGSPRVQNLLSVYPGEEPDDELKEFSTLKIGEPGKPWWSKMRLFRVESGNEKEIDFEPLTYGATKSIALGEGQGGSVKIAIPTAELANGKNEIVATLEHDGKTIRSRPTIIKLARRALSPYKKDIHMALYHLSADHPEEALGFATSAAESKPQKFTPHGLKARALERLGRDKDALEAYTKAIALFPEDAYEPPVFYMRKMRELREKLYPDRRRNSR